MLQNCRIMYKTSEINHVFLATTYSNKTEKYLQWNICVFYSLTVKTLYKTNVLEDHVPTSSCWWYVSDSSSQMLKNSVPYWPHDNKANGFTTLVIHWSIVCLCLLPNRMLYVLDDTWGAVANFISEKLGMHIHLQVIECEVCKLFLRLSRFPSGHLVQKHGGQEHFQFVHRNVDAVCQCVSHVIDWWWLQPFTLPLPTLAEAGNLPRILEGITGL